MNTQVRNSNIELLRIIAMIFIVIYHISIHAQKGILPSHNYVVSITATGVNLFVLISGYFGIKLRWKSLLNILSIVTFYYVIQYAADILIFKTPLSVGYIINIVTPISRNCWWFVICYIVMMLLSPGLNIIKDNATVKQYKLLIAIMIYLNCVSGFVFGNAFINPNGYSIFQFITLYFIGDAIKRFNIANRFKSRQLWYIYMLSTIALFIFSGTISNDVKYNNPILMIAAVSFFCIFTKANFKNRCINYIATFMLPIYLLQDCPLGFKIYHLMFQKGCETDFAGWEYYSTIGLYILMLLALVFIMESVRRFLFDNLIDKACRKIKKKANIFDE